METTFTYLIAAIISLIIFYYLIRGAVKEAIIERMEPFLKMQTAYLRYLAKQAGMTEEQIKEVWAGKSQKKN